MAIFIPRLHMGNIYNMLEYTSYNPYYPTYGMPNCVAYTFGRFNELNHEHALNYKWPTGDGYQWFLQAPGKGLLTGSQPQLGATICWWYYQRDDQGNPVLDPQGNVIPTGHTAIVEEIFYDSNGNWTHLTTSNSAWMDRPIGTPVEQFPYFYTRTIYRASINSVPGHPEAYWQGFIYHPQFPPGGSPLDTAKLISALAAGNERMQIKLYRKRRLI